MGTKFFLNSKTIIGALIVIVAPLLNQFFGVQIDEAMQVEISDLLTEIVRNFGAVLAIYGRVKATKKLAVL